MDTPKALHPGRAHCPATRSLPAMATYTACLGGHAQKCADGRLGRFLAVRMRREAAARDWSAHHSLGRSPLVVPLSGVGREHSARGDLVHLGWARSLLLSLAHLTKLVSFNWSQRPADLTPCEELLGSRRAARSRRLFSGYCCCCSLESVHSPLPSGKSPCCFLLRPGPLAVKPWAGLHLGGVRGWIGGRCSKIETAAVVGL